MVIQLIPDQQRNQAFVHCFELEIKQHIEAVEEINTGINNRLFKITTDAGNTFLAKFYLVDRIPRLQNEYNGYKLLEKNRIFKTPKAYFKNEEHNFALYSFEQGQTKTVEELSSQDMQEISIFITELQNITIDSTFHFQEVNEACFKIKDYIEHAQNRIRTFSDISLAKQIQIEVQSILNTENIGSWVNNYFDKITSQPHFSLLAEKYTSMGRTYGMNDFGGANNTIFRDDGSSCFIDFEFFGIDHPFKMVVDFVNHAKNITLSPELKEQFLLSYKKERSLSDQESKILDLTNLINKIEWITILIGWMTTQKLESRKHGNPNFNEEKYTREKLQQLRSYVESLDM